MKSVRLLVGVLALSSVVLTGLGCSSSGSSSTASKTSAAVRQNPTSKFCTRVQAFSNLKGDTRAQREAKLAAYDQLAPVMPPALKQSYTDLRGLFSSAAVSGTNDAPKLSSKQQAAYTAISAYTRKACGG